MPWSCRPPWAGEGIALGWRHVLDRLLKQNLLVKVGPWEWKTDMGFYLIRSSLMEHTKQADVVRNWILRTAQPSSAEHDA